MRRNTRKRSKTPGGKLIAAAAAFTLGAGGLVVVNVYASAGEESSTNTIKRATGNGAAQVGTIDCPDVGE